MGIETQTLQLLLASKNKYSVNFNKTLTLGRQNSFLSEPEIKNIFKEYGINYSTIEESKYSRNKYSENLFKYLGVNELSNLDFSGYEGADLIYDLNYSIPKSLYNLYDCVLDLGTLEHVFNFPRAIQNCMNMVRVNGHFISMTPCNNQFGHGFYQFSPELFYSMFNENTGFIVEDVIVVEFSPFYRWYRVNNPEKIKMRTVMSNNYVTNLFVISKRIEIKQIENIYPNQSDLLSQWESRSTPEQSGYIDCFSDKKFDNIKSILLKFPKLARALEAIRFSSWNRQLSLSNKKCFFRIKNKLNLT